MVVLDQFYQIVDAKTSTISNFWKVAHVFTFALSAICGFITAFSIGRTSDIFNYNCVLGAKIVFENDSFLNYTSDGTVKHVRAMDLTHTVWGVSSSCNFAQFTPLFLTISAVLWGAFFTLLAKGGAGYRSDLLAKPWVIVYPCLIFTIIVFIIYLVSTMQLSSGMTSFCKEFRSQLNTTECVPAINVYSSQFLDDKHKSYVLLYNFYVNMRIALASSDIGLWTWLVQMALTMARICCVVDFELRLITIESKEEELVETITEFPDISDEEYDQVSQV